MSQEPQPWLSTLDKNSPLREMLENAAADEPSAAQLDALATKLSTLLNTPVAAGAAAGAKGSALTAAKTWVVASATAAVVGTGAFQAGRVYEQKHAPPPPPPKAVVVPAPIPVPTPVVEPAAPQPPAMPAVVPKPRKPEDTFEAETALLEKAMMAAQMGQWNDVLRQLSRHQEVFPKGALAQEREVLWVQALVELGEVEKAAARVSRFKALWPTSPHVRRLEGLLKK